MAAPQQIEQVRLPLVCTCFPETWRHLSKSNKFVCLRHMFSRAQHGQTQRHSIAGPTFKSLRKSRIF